MISFLRPWLLLLLLGIPSILIFYRKYNEENYKDRRRRTALIARLFVVLFLALAASDARIQSSSDRVDTMFVLDVSDSVGSRSEQAGLAIINTLIKGTSGEDTAGLVTVAAAAVVEQPGRPGSAAFEYDSLHDRSRSNLADGLYSAAASLSGGGERRIVLVSDGRSTEGQLDEASRFAGRLGIIIDVLPIGSPPGPDAAIQELILPSGVSEGQVHDLSVLLSSGQGSAGRLVILRNGEYIGEDRFQLKSGQDRKVYTMPGSEAGSQVYEVILDTPIDTTLENNRGIAVLRVEGPPKVLWVGQGVSAIPEALRLQGLETMKVLPGDLPDSFSALSAWDAVILDNVSSRELSLKTLDLLESWVRTRGGGLMMIGGDASFGLGAYQGTPVERALPVDMDSPASLYIPSLSMVMVIDKSGSMGGDAGDGKTKLDVVKDAVLGAVEALNPLYTIGLAAFDANVEWTIPLTEAGNAAQIRSGLAGLRSGGGTVLYPAIREAYDRLVQSPAALRHLVILSDGLAETADYGPLIDAISEDGISVSTVSVGRDADSKLMAELAEKGGGRYWYAEEASEVPKIFASESMIVSRGLVLDETIFPKPASPAEALEGIDLSSMPPLHGYVMTYADTLAVEALVSPRGHPILVYGSHGLGRTVAFTSDLRGSWGRDWVSWDQFPRLLAQTIRWMRRNPGSADTALNLYEENGTVQVVLEARSETGGYHSDLNLEGIVTPPDQREAPLVLIQTAPGRYEGQFRPVSDGIYNVAVLDEARGLGATSDWSRAYSPELRSAGIDTAALVEAAREGGGRLLSGQEDPEQWWKVRDPRQKTLAELAIPLLILALLFFLTDIGLREVPGHRREGRHSKNGEPPDLEELILRGIDDERHKPKYRRPSPAEAARILAVRRAERRSAREPGS